MFENFTDRARAALVMARRASTEYEHHYIGCEHLLVGLSAIPDGVAAQVLTEMGAPEDTLRSVMLAHAPRREGLEEREAEALATIGIDIAKVRETVAQAYGPAALPDYRNNPPFTPRAKNALEQSMRESAAMYHWYIGTEHMLLGVLVDEENFAVKMLDDIGVDRAELRREVVARVAPDVVRARELIGKFRAIHSAAQATADEAKRDRLLALQRETMSKVNAARSSHHAESRAALARLIGSLESAWDEADAALTAENSSS